MEKENDVLVLEKSNKTGFVLLFLGVLLLIGGVAYYYLAYFNNPSYLVKQGIKKMASVYNSKNEIDTSKIMRISGGIEFDFKSNDVEMQNIYDLFNDMEILYNIDSDAKNEIISTKLNSKYQDKDLINAKFYQEKDNSYLYLEDLYDKYIKFSELTKEEANSSNIREEDLEIILNGLIDTFSKAFLEDDFYREKEEITYDNEKVEVYKNYVVYDKNNYKEVNERVVKAIKENKELLSTLQKIIGEEEVNEMLNEISNMKDLENFSSEFIIYTKGYTNEFVKVSLKLENDVDYVIIEMDNKEAFSVSIMSDGVDMKVTFEQNEQNNYVFNIDIIEEELGNINIKLSIILENIESIEKIDEKNVVDYQELSEDDMNKIMENINKNDAINKIIADLSGVLSGDLAFSM